MNTSYQEKLKKAAESLKEYKQNIKNNMQDYISQTSEQYINDFESLSKPSMKSMPVRTKELLQKYQAQLEFKPNYVIIKKEEKNLPKMPDLQQYYYQVNSLASETLKNPFEQSNTQKQEITINKQELLKESIQDEQKFENHNPFESSSLLQYTQTQALDTYNNKIQNSQLSSLQESSNIQPLSQTQEKSMDSQQFYDSIEKDQDQNQLTKFQNKFSQSNQTHNSIQEEINESSQKNSNLNGKEDLSPEYESIDQESQVIENTNRWSDFHTIPQNTAQFMNPKMTEIQENRSEQQEYDEKFDSLSNQDQAKVSQNYQQQSKSKLNQNFNKDSDMYKESLKISQTSKPNDETIKSSFQSNQYRESNFQDKSSQSKQFNQQQMEQKQQQQQQQQQQSQQQQKQKLFDAQDQISNTEIPKMPMYQPSQGGKAIIKKLSTELFLDVERFEDSTILKSINRTQLVYIANKKFDAQVEQLFRILSKQFRILKIVIKFKQKQQRNLAKSILQSLRKNKDNQLTKQEKDRMIRQFLHQKNLQQMKNIYDILNENARQRKAIEQSSVQAMKLYRKKILLNRWKYKTYTRKVKYQMLLQYKLTLFEGWKSIASKQIQQKDTKALTFFYYSKLRKHFLKLKLYANKKIQIKQKYIQTQMAIQLMKKRFYLNGFIRFVEISKKQKEFEAFAQQANEYIPITLELKPQKVKLYNIKS